MLNFAATHLQFSGSGGLLCRRAFAGCLGTLMGYLSPAWGQTSTDAAIADAAPVTVPVIFVQATLGKQQSAAHVCWEVLIPERQLLIRQENAKPWLLKNVAPLTGSVMGGVTAGLVLKRHAKAAVFKRWGVPVIVGGAGAGFLLGPGGVVGAVLGGGLAEILGKQRRPITLGGVIGGAMAGKAVWDMVFPPAVPPAPGTEPDDDIPAEVFLRDEVCGKKIDIAYTQSMYRVSYRFNDEEFTTDLPYDPGDALLIGATGDIKGPARIRLD